MAKVVQNDDMMRDTCPSARSLLLLLLPLLLLWPYHISTEGVWW